ncbi:MAG: chemotaxis protein CheA [Nitrospiraceae bacterium]|jgi:two-component system chemotaxis sensor kinase CheA|nr:chemotaxis protein CheA [Nitrospiraceae bacterium]
MSEGFDNDEMKEIVQDFLQEASEMLEGLDNYFVQLENNPEDRTLLNEIFRTAHSIKGSAGFIGLNRIVEVAHHAENVLNQLRTGNMRAEPAVVDIILESMDALKVLVNEVRTGEQADVDIDGINMKLDLLLQWGEDTHSETPGEEAGGADSEMASAVREEKVLDTRAMPKEEASLEESSLPETSAVPPPLPPSPPSPPPVSHPGPQVVRPASSREEAQNAEAGSPKGAEGGGGGEADQTIRVEISRLDSVMNLVGELVLGRNRLVKLSGDIDGVTDFERRIKEVAEAISQLNRVTTDLQTAVIKTRMQPIKKVLGKFPRMVRDLSRKMGKSIRLELSGEETELDKSVIEEIGDPLVHIIRNSIDHGIEMPDDRIAQGKDPEGVVRISAYQEGNSIVIEISDDGRGIDAEKIRRKAVEKGIITEADAMRLTDSEAVNIIFMPGFSTAEKVTDVSGRGVGMDVVRTNINKINGSVEISTQKGAGSTFTIRLPLTIAIIQALMVTIGPETYAIPLASVVETVKITEKDIKTLSGSEVLNLRQQVLPLIRLRDEFKVPHQGDGTGIPEGQYVVVVQVGSKNLGLVVDRLPYQEEVVIKSMGQILSGIRGLAGATITGDGRVVIILDVGEILQDVSLRVKKGVTSLDSVSSERLEAGV